MLSMWVAIGLIGIGTLLVINIVVWGIVGISVYKRWKRHKEEQRIIDLIIKITERAEDSGNESDGEDKETLATLLHNNGFDNPMFEDRI
ncbi:vpu protein [Simian immunodeficiency virus]|uniref:Protein Vpu n=1 Tax=Simian immunodeficiency virus TaxID=11723 RepID=Q5K6J1_SIV|nr:vpu protein [Simian immunodeficiency virus]